MCFAGIVLAYIFIQGIGIAAVDVLAEHTAEGVWPVLGGGLLGGLALVVIALASIGHGAMTVYGASLALQTIGVRVRRPESTGGRALRRLPVAAQPLHQPARKPLTPSATTYY